MFQSPLQTVSEKIRPVSSKSAMSSLNFDRSSDFKKFINFLKLETKELEKIKLPKISEVKPTGKRKGVFGLFGIGLFGLLAAGASGKGGVGDGGDDDKLFPTAGGTASQFKEVGLPLIGKVQPARKIGEFRSRRAILKRITVSPKVQEKLGKKKERIIKKKTIRGGDRTIRGAKEGLIKQKMMIQEGTQRFNDEFFKTKKEILNSYRLKYDLAGAPDEIIEDIISTDKKIDVNKEIGKITRSRLRKKRVAFFDPTVNVNDQVQQIRSDKGFQRLLKEVLKPIDIDDVKELQQMLNSKTISAAEKKDIKEMLRDSEVRKILKEDKFRRESPDFETKGGSVPAVVPEAKTFFKNTRFEFRPKYVLDDLFTGIGEKTKPLRERIIKDFRKTSDSVDKFFGLDPRRVEFVSTRSMGLSILKNVGRGLDIINAAYETYKLGEGLVVGDNIFTALYDLFVSIENTIQPDKTRLKTFITKSRDPRINAFKKLKNRKILDQIKQAEQAQAGNNNISPNNQSSILPGATTTPGGGQFVIPFSPQYSGFMFIMDKLYKQ